MAYTPPKTWKYKESLSMTDLNTYLRDNMIAQDDRYCPVGSLREFGVSTNPNILMGFGTWELYGVGRVTVCIDTSDTNFDTLGEEVGESAHLLTASESGLPSHNHSLSSGWSDNGADASLIMSDEGAGGTRTNYTNNAGGSDASSAHNNIQKSKVVYRWIRTA